MDISQDNTQTVESKPRKKRERIWKRALGKILSPLTKVLDSVDADFADRSWTRKTLIAMLKLRTPICILLILAVVFSSCYFLFKSSSVATTEMSLNYEESAYGLYPNSTRMNVHDIASPDVVEKMLSYCGIDPKSVDVNSVVDCISVRPVNAKAFSEDNLFISTTYKVTLKKPELPEDVSTKDLLTFLCKAYKDVLYTKYTENRSILGFDIDRFNDEEYMEIADLLDLKAQQIEKYLSARVKQSKTFTEKESDETFKSLLQKAEDIRNYDIAKYRSFVIEAGCSNDKESYIRSLSYVNSINQIDYKKNMAAYEVRNEGVKMYNDAMINIVMIPSIDTERKTYYMSKTKTGMDYLASQADDYLLKAQETAKQIKVNNELIGKMSRSRNKASSIEKANSMIKEIRRKFTDLSRQVETIDKAYVKHKTKDYLTFKTSNPSLSERMNLSMVFVIAAVLLCAVYAALWFRFRYSGGGDKE